MPLSCEHSDDCSIVFIVYIVYHLATVEWATFDKGPIWGYFQVHWRGSNTPPFWADEHLHWMKVTVGLQIVIGESINLFSQPA